MNYEKQVSIKRRTAANIINNFSGLRLNINTNLPVFIFLHNSIPQTGNYTLVAKPNTVKGFKQK